MKTILKSLQTGDIQSFLEGYRKAVTEKVLREKNECKPQALRELNEGKNNAMYFHNFDKPKYRQVAPKYKIFSKELLKQYIKACVTEADLMFSNLIQKEVGKDNYKKTLEDIQKQLESYVEKTHDYQLWHFEYKNSNISKPLLEDIVRAMHVRAKIFMYDIFKVQKLPQNIVKEIRWAIGKLFDNDDYLQLREVDPLVADLYHLAKFYPSILNNTQEMEKFIKTLKLESTLSVLMDEKKNSEQVAEVLLNGLRKLYKLPLTESLREPILFEKLDNFSRSSLQTTPLFEIVPLPIPPKAIMTDAELKRFSNAVAKAITAEFKELGLSRFASTDAEIKDFDDKFPKQLAYVVSVGYKSKRDFSFWKWLDFTKIYTEEWFIKFCKSNNVAQIYDYEKMLTRSYVYIGELRNITTKHFEYPKSDEADKIYTKYESVFNKHKGDISQQANRRAFAVCLSTAMVFVGLVNKPDTLKDFLEKHISDGRDITRALSYYGSKDLQTEYIKDLTDNIKKLLKV